MNPDTGVIKEFESQRQAILDGYTIPVRRLPKPSCRSCSGRGHVGKNDQGQFVPCSCVMRKDDD